MQKHGVVLGTVVLSVLLVSALFRPQSVEKKEHQARSISEPEPPQSLAQKQPATACNSHCQHARHHASDMKGEAEASAAVRSTEKAKISPADGEVATNESTEPAVAPSSHRSISIWKPAPTPRDATCDQALRYRFDPQALKMLLAGLGPAPVHNVPTIPAVHEGAMVLPLPRPDGATARFRIHRTVVREPGNAVHGQTILFGGRNVAAPDETIAGGYAPGVGFHALVMGAGPIVTYERPRDAGADTMEVVDTSSLPAGLKQLGCLVDHEEFEAQLAEAGLKDEPFTLAHYQAARGLSGARGRRAMGRAEVVGTTLRTFRLAVASTVEATAALGGQGTTDTQINIWINELNMIYERDVCVTFTRVGGQNLLFNTEPDGYTNNDLNQVVNNNTAIINGIIGSGAYDIGHVLNSTTGGLAGPTPCIAGSKGRGTSGVGAIATFVIGMFAHEIGHQFGASHSMNGINGNCHPSNGGRSSGNSIEPGAGSTIMAYSEICPIGGNPGDPGVDNYPGCAGPIDTGTFLFHSILQMENAIQNSSTCATMTPTGNVVPDVEAGTAKTIPINTPFELTATRIDTDTDAVTYSWEEMTIGPDPGAELAAADNGSIPLFRALPPSTSPTRTFPLLPNLLDCSSLTCTEEKLPQQPRVLEFMAVIRDNTCGVGMDSVEVTVDSSGPFEITSPNGGETWTCDQIVTWNVNGVDAAPIHATTVDILLSIDGGLSFPFTLASATPNDGSQMVTLPDINSTTARIRIQPPGHCFFDISKEDFTLQVCPTSPFVAGSLAFDDSTGCNNGSGGIDPGECDIALTIPIMNVSGAAATGVQGCLIPLTPGVTVMEDTQDYGDLNDGATANNGMPYLLCLDASVPCGELLSFQFDMKSDQGNNSTLIQIQSGILTQHIFTYSAFSNGDPVVVIPPFPTTIRVNLNVAGVGGPIVDVDLLIGGNNCSAASSAPANQGNGITMNGEEALRFWLNSPMGTQIQLADGNNANVGSGNICQARFTDEATMSWDAEVLWPGGSSTPPHTGNWLPLNPLSGFDGENPNGTWSFDILHGFTAGACGGFDPWCSHGELREFSLIISSYECEPLPPTVDLVISKTATNCAVAGEEITYTVSVNNLGPGAATNIGISDFPDPNLTLTGSANRFIPVLGAGASTTYTFTATSALFAGFVTNSIVVTSSVCDVDNANNEAQAVTEIKLPYDLVVTKTATNEVDQGSNLIYDIVVSNAGPAVAANVVLTDNLPAGLTPAAVGPFNLGNIPVGGAVRQSITTLVSSAAGTITNTAFAMGDGTERNPADNTDTATTVVLVGTCLLEVVQSVNGPLRCGPEPFDLAVVVTNAGDAACTDAVLQVMLPACLDAPAQVPGLTCALVTNGPDVELSCQLDLPILTGFGSTTVVFSLEGDCPTQDLLDVTSFVFYSNANNLATNRLTLTNQLDTLQPVFGMVPANTNTGCITNNPFDTNAVLGSVTDNCAVAGTDLVVTTFQVGAACEFMVEYIFVAWDAASNFTAVTSVHQYILDSGAPTFTNCPTGEVNLGWNPTTFPDPQEILGSASDDCSIATSWVDSVTNTTAPCDSVITHTYWAVDGCSNQVSCTQVIRYVTDTQSPVFTNCLATTNLGCNSAASDFPTASILGSAIDNCGVATSWFNEAASTNGCEVTLTQTFYAVDFCENTGTCTVVITYSGQAGGPSFACPTGSTDLGCNPTAFIDTAMILAAVTDICTIVDSGVNSTTNDSNPCASVITHVYWAVNSCMVTGSCTQIVTYSIDTQPPVFTNCFGVRSLPCNPTHLPDTNLVLNSAVDHCGIDRRWVNESRTNNGCEVTLTRVYFAVDTCGNTGVCTNVYLYTLDTDPPDFVLCPTSLVDLGCNPTSGLDVASILASATDNCAVADSWVTNSITNAGCRTTETWLFFAVDGCGQTGICTAVVAFVTDTSPPVFTNCIALTHLGCSPMPDEFPDPLDTLNSATDNCGVVTSWFTEIRVTNGCDVSLTQTFYAVDGCDQTGQCITVIEFTGAVGGPSFSCPTSITALGCNPTSLVDTAEILATATDFCGVVDSGVISITNNADACAITVTHLYWAVNACMVTGLCTQVVTYAYDTSAPVLTHCINTHLGCGPDPSDFPDPVAILAAATDNCGVVTSWFTEASTTNGCFVTLTQRLFAVDGCDNTGTCVMVIDYQGTPGGPSFTCPTGITALGCNPTSFVDPTDILASATDICGVTTAGVISTRVTTGCDTVVTHIYWAANACLITGICTQVVTWTIDPSAPVFTNCYGTTNLGCNPVPANFPDDATVLASATDDCGVITSWMEEFSGIDGCLVTRTQFFYAVDGCGQTGMCMGVISYIVNPGAPTFGCPSGVLDLGCNPDPTDFPDPTTILATADDTCGVVSSWVDSATNMPSPWSVVITHTFYAVNNCDVTGTCEQVIEYAVDTTAPVFTNCSTGVVQLGCSPDAADFPDPTTVLSHVVEACGVSTSWYTEALSSNGCDFVMTQSLYAVDICNNTGFCQQVIAWSGSTGGPEFAGFIGGHDHLGCAPVMIPDAASVLTNVTDLCGLSNTWFIQTSVTVNCDTSLTQTFYAVNICGITSSVSRSFEFRTDTNAPVVICPGDTHLGCGPSPGDFPDTDAIISNATDDCGIQGGWVTATSATNGCDITLTQTVWAVDTCGNTGTCSFVVSYSGSIGGPSFPACTWAATTLVCNAGASDVPNPADVLATVTDICGVMTSYVDVVGATNGCQATLTQHFTAVSVCDVTSACQRVMTWSVDTQPPAFTVAVPTGNFGCGDASLLPPTSNVLNSVTDNCGVATTWVTQIFSIQGCETVVTQIFHALDGCGHSASVTGVVRYSGANQPVFTSTTWTTTNLECNATHLPGPTTNEVLATAFDPCGLTNMGVIETMGRDGCRVSVTQTFRAVNICNTTGTLIRVASWIEDRDTPLIICGANMNLGCNPTALPDPEPIYNTAVDACGIETNWWTGTSATNGCQVTFTQTFYALDACGHTGSCSRILWWSIDIDTPAIDCGPNLWLDCNPATYPDGSEILMTASDVCGIVTGWVSETSFSTGCVAGVTQTFYVVDDCEHTGTCSRVLTWGTDTNAPVIDCGPNLWLGCHPTNIPNGSNILAAATDNCSIATNWMTTTPFDDGCVEGVTQTFYAVDGCDQTSRCSRVLTWGTDTHAPMIGLTNNLIELPCNSTYTTDWNSITSSISDNCATMVMVRVSTSRVNTGCTSWVTEVVEAVDDCDNTGSYTRVIQWQSNTNGPRIVCGWGNTNLGCNATEIPDPADWLSTITSDCGSYASTTWVLTVTDGCNVVQTQWVMAVDDCNNTSSCSRVVTWSEDDQPPGFTHCPTSVIEVASGAPLPAPTAVATDNCEVISQRAVTNALSTNEMGDVDTEVILSATDCAGASATCVITYVYVFTNFELTLTCPTGLTDYGCIPDNFNSNAVLFSATSDCDIVSRRAEFTETPGSNCTVHVLVEYEVTDSCGNTATCSQTWSYIDDTIPPVFTYVPTHVTECLADTNAGGHATATDACGAVRIDFTNRTTELAGGSLQVERIWTATDGCSNLISVTQTIVRVLPGIPYFISVPADTNGCDLITSTSVLGVAEIMVDCGDVSLGMSNRVRTSGCTQIIERIWTAEGESNTAAATQRIENLMDDGPPDLTIPADEAFGCDPAAPKIATVTDACPATLDSFDEQSTNGCVITTRRTWTAVDACGNEVSGTQTWTRIADDAPPALTIPQDVSKCETTINADPGLTGQATATDTCGGVAVTFVDQTQAVACGTTILRTWTARDGCDNATSGVQRIDFLTDDQAPTLTCPEIALVAASPDGHFRIPDVATLVIVDDACSAVTLSQNPPAHSIFASAVPAAAFVDVTARDACGNISTCRIQLRSASCIGDLVWEDLNGNGLQDGGEPGVEGVTVILFDAASNELARTQSDADGHYLFFMDPFAGTATPGKASVPTFVYFLGYDPASTPGYIPTQQTGGDERADSNVRSSGISEPIELLAGEHDLTRDIGLVRPVDITGYLWEDLNQDGSPTNEVLENSGLGGAPIQLIRINPDGSESVVETVITERSGPGTGRYEFESVPPGTYRLEVNVEEVMNRFPDRMLEFLTNDDVFRPRFVVTSGQTPPLPPGLGFSAVPTAVVLQSLQAARGVVHWTVASEREVLGYRLIDLSTGEAVGPMIATHAGVQGNYAVQVDPGQYRLEEITTDLQINELGTVTHYVEVDATPTGDPTRAIQIGEVPAEFDTEPGISTWLVTGLAREPLVLDVTDPKSPIRLIGEVLQTENGVGVYFSYTANRRLRLE